MAPSPSPGTLDGSRTRVEDLRLAVGPGRGIERDGLLAHAVEMLDLRDRPAERRRQLLAGRRAAELLGQLAPLLLGLTEQELDVDGEADHPRLVGEGANDPLADPPRGIRGKARAAVGAKLPSRVQEPHVALLDKVQERQPPVQIAPRDGHDEPQVGLDELALGLGVPGLNAAGQRLLLLCGQEPDAPDVVEVEAQDLLGLGGRLRSLGRISE